MAMVLVVGKKYNVVTSDGVKFRAVFMGECQGVAQFVGHRYYAKDIVSAVEVTAKPAKAKAVVKKVCARCGGTGKYLHYGECYGCGGRGQV